MEIFSLDTPQKHEHDILLDVWESSVRATHDFLKDGDIEVFKKLIQEQDIFSAVMLTCARDNAGTIVGFLGVSEENLEMLFVHADQIGKGAGKLLLLHAIGNCGIRKVDVNEQNTAALEFYQHFGFRVMSRSDVDGMGKPYPILHLELV